MLAMMRTHGESEPQAVADLESAMLALVARRKSKPSKASSATANVVSATAARHGRKSWAETIFQPVSERRHLLLFM